MTKFDDDVKQCVPGSFFMIASSADNQESEEAYNTTNFELPNPNGKQGGACTSAFLQQQYDGAAHGSTWVETLSEMRDVLKSMGYQQTPTLSSSRPVLPHHPMRIVPPGSGKRRAILIGINYVGQNGELRACHNDCNNVKDFLIDVHGFREDEMLILMDDGKHQEPTKANIENAFVLLTKYSQPNDVCFVSFSGHGGNTEDLNGDEDDGWDETLIPVDFRENGQIVDDDILKMLVKPMKKGVHCTVLMDCCHSGTVLDLPYKLAAGQTKSKREVGFDTEIVREAVRPRKKTMEEIKAIKKQRTKKEAQERKRQEAAAKGSNDNNNGEEPEEVVVGPKLAPNGQPVLPIRAPRPQQAEPVMQEEEGREDTTKKQPKKKKWGRKQQQLRDEQAPPPPPGQCLVQ
jgi:hypothetical protein